MKRDDQSSKDELKRTNPDRATSVSTRDAITLPSSTQACALSLAAQIRVGLWRRNGHAMNDQLMNYSEPPFCKIFRDLDLLLVQIVSLAYGADNVVEHCLRRLDRRSPLIKAKADSARARPSTTRSTPAEEGAPPAQGRPPAAIRRRCRPHGPVGDAGVAAWLRPHRTCSGDVRFAAHILSSAGRPLSSS